MLPAQVKSGCGVFGVLRKYHAPRIGVEVALMSIECVRYRGSKLGAGFARISTDGSSHKKRLKVFADGRATIDRVSSYIEREHGIRVLKVIEEYDSYGKVYGSFILEVDGSVNELDAMVHDVNIIFSRNGFEARVYCWGRYVDVFKGVGYPRDVYELYDLAERAPPADLWLSHTRQPTNSPGRLPIWSHPFSAGEWAIVHNGDISSFGANMEFLWSVGVRSFVGTDSEVIAYLLDYLTRVESLTIQEAAELLCCGFEGELKGPDSLSRAIKFRGAILDGPFTVVAGYSDGDDVYLLALTDRFKFRPIVVGEDENNYYVASEEAEIRAISRSARVWTIRPGGFFLASMKRGVIVYGRDVLPERGMRPKEVYPSSRGIVIDASEMDYRRLNLELKKHVMAGATDVDVINVNGHRYIGVGIDKEVTIRIYGTPGNCLANFNRRVHFEVFGNAQDDVADAMYGGSVVIYGDCRDVLGQALQGGHIYVKGNAGNRCGIQMREFKDRQPIIIIGGRVDDYLGEYMAGGVIVVLGLNQMSSKEPIVGKCVASGMVGGRIYVRGRVPTNRIGLNPPLNDVLQYLEGCVLDGLMSVEDYERVKEMDDISYYTLSKCLPEKAFSAVSKLFTNKYFKPLKVEYRHLERKDLALIGQHLRNFGEKMGLHEEISSVIEEEFTVIEPM